MNMKKGTKISSQIWLKRNAKDAYAKNAKKTGYRCRSAFKLLEIEEKFKIVSSSLSKDTSVVIDLGCAPGGWLQVISSIYQKTNHFRDKYKKKEHNIDSSSHKVIDNNIDGIFNCTNKESNFELYEEKNNNSDSCNEGLADSNLFKFQKTQISNQDINPNSIDILNSNDEINNFNIIGVDLKNITKVPFTHAICGDFEEDSVQQDIIHLLNGRKITTIFSDMCPNSSGDRQLDQIRIMNLLNSVVAFSDKFIKKNGSLVMKIIIGGIEIQLIKNLRLRFEKVTLFKPKSSHATSSEIYVICYGKK